MALEQTLARYSELLINTGDRYTIVDAETISPPTSPEAAVWTKISELTNLGPSRSKGTADSSSYDNAGWDDHIVTNRGMSLAVTYNMLVDDSNPLDVLRDAGQQELEALTYEIGAAAVGQFMWRILNTDEVIVFNATADLNGPGGATNALGEISSTLQVKGVPYRGEEPALSTGP